MVTLALPVLPPLEQLSVNMMLPIVLGTIVSDPLTGFEPDHPLLPKHDEALVDDQLTITLEPATNVSVSTVTDTVGVGAAGALAPPTTAAGKRCDCECHKKSDRYFSHGNLLLFALFKLIRTHIKKLLIFILVLLYCVLARLRVVVAGIESN